MGITEVVALPEGEALIEIVTDHAALQWLCKIKDSPSTRHNNRLLRWSLLLSQYAGKISIIHRPGRHHGNVDGLSCLISQVAHNKLIAVALDSPAPSTALPVEIDSEDNWEDLYLWDPSLARIYAKLKEEASTSDRQTSYHSFSFDPATKRLYTRIQDVTVLCVPKSLLSGMVMNCHEQHGHLGASKIYDRLSRDIWFPTLYRACFSDIQQCASCREHSIMQYKPWGLATPVLSPAVPFDTVAMDFVSGIPECDGFDSFFTVTDKFTKTIRLVPCLTRDTAPAMARRFFDSIV